MLRRPGLGPSPQRNGSRPYASPRVLCTLRVVYATGGRPIEATSMVKAGHLYELQYEFVPEEYR
ncbi:hypothetical protein FHS41_004592 [Streptomyces violarus]|uniref:UbiC transcription regulator-associated domain-containing protein n=1 Tax=Streptomyces violarus TaxID=67380 RepID=A0A7W4ZSX2_9ACTN|nr:MULTISPECIES: hypothetical protein [Streptomyces]MBB3078085.1 hypothetical protein [Streptomyces violarus]WRT99758.1 hypothetical protein VJ737_19540 [Streptomyces sp. CGMCC 4.1772]